MTEQQVQQGIELLKKAAEIFREHQPVLTRCKEAISLTRHIILEDTPIIDSYLNQNTNEEAPYCNCRTHSDIDCIG